MKLSQKWKRSKRGGDSAKNRLRSGEELGHFEVIFLLLFLFFLLLPFASSFQIDIFDIILHHDCVFLRLQGSVAPSLFE